MNHLKKSIDWLSIQPEDTQYILVILFILMSGLIGYGICLFMVYRMVGGI